MQGFSKCNKICNFQIKIRCALWKLGHKHLSFVCNCKVLKLLNIYTVWGAVKRCHPNVLCVLENNEKCTLIINIFSLDAPMVAIKMSLYSLYTNTNALVHCNQTSRRFFKNVLQGIGSEFDHPYLYLNKYKLL